MSSRQKWQDLKNNMSKVGVDTSLFGDGLGPYLDSFDTAVAKFDKGYENYRGTTRPGADPKIRGLAQDVSTAGKKVLATLTTYEASLHHLAENATDPRQKTAVEEAASWALQTINAISQGLKRLPH